jgi:chemotaxis protein MotA
VVCRRGCGLNGFVTDAALETGIDCSAHVLENLAWFVAIPARQAELASITRESFSIASIPGFCPQMVVIGGCVFVLAAVLIGFSMAGGHPGCLIHFSEFVTIGGAALGSMFVMSPKKVLVDLIRAILQLIKGSPYGKSAYNELFMLLYSLARLVRRDGILALETVINDPHESPLFKKYGKIGQNHHATTFLCEALAMLVDGKADPAKLTSALEEEIGVIGREHHAAISVLTKTADALPGFGIVAAVLGIVITMGHIDGPASEIGHKVGAALVGTFLGILLSYGFFAPMAARMEFFGEAERTFFRAMSTGVVALSEGENPREVVVRARRVVGTECRSSQAELNQLLKDAESN